MAQKNEPTTLSKKTAVEVAQINMAILANQDAQVVSNKKGGPDKTARRVDINGKSPLIALPVEVKHIIWVLCVTNDGPIQPHQLRERSNKFIWSTSQIDQVTRAKMINNAATLTVVQLSKVCRTIYDEINNTHIFYQVNTFHFNNPTTYLISLTSPRMNTIRSISCDWSRSHKEAPKLFTVLAACAGLKDLTLISHGGTMPYWSHLKDTFMDYSSMVPGYEELIGAVEGLQSLQIKACYDVTSCCCTSIYNQQRPGILLCLERELWKKMKQPRGTTRYNRETLLDVQREASLDIHGEGRLGEDKRPSIIASRTRNGLRNAEILDDDGVMPKRAIPKYDAHGDLAWYVSEVMSSRISEPDGFPPSVEFQVKIYPGSGRYPQPSPAAVEVAWEDVTVLGGSKDCRRPIVDFLRHNPLAYGLEEVIAAWKVRDRDSNSSLKRSEKAYFKNRTNELIKLAATRRAAEERKAKEDEEEAAWEVAKATKKARKRNQA